VRRLVTIPAVLLMAPLSVLTAPFWIPGLALVDLVRRRRGAALRCGALATWYLQCEALGLVASFGLWLIRGADPAAYLHRNRRLQQIWAMALYRGALRIFAIEVEVEGQEAVRETPFLLFARHASLADTLLPTVLAAIPFDTHLRHVLKRQLLWDPCLDVVGHRLPNIFVRRSAFDSRPEIEAVGALADDLGPGEGVLIYPEGTRFTPPKRERTRVRLREQQRAALLARAESLERVLLPRPGGALALIEHARTQTSCSARTRASRTPQRSATSGPGGSWNGTSRRPSGGFRPARFPLTRSSATSGSSSSGSASTTGSGRKARVARPTSCSVGTW